MQGENIAILILVIGLIIERILKHFKKSTCCGNSSVEFNEDVETPKYPDISKIIA